MLRPSLILTFLRELFVSRSLPREPEPDLVLSVPAQVAGYAEAGRIEGVMAASYLFQSARISQVIRGSKSVLDLGCGPATQLAQIAELNPEIEFTGMDLSPTMLGDAERYVASRGLTNVRFKLGDISKLEGVPDQSVDAVISTVALHHLPTRELLADCFRQIRRVLKPGGAIYLTDFCRLKSLKSVLTFAYMNRDRQPHIFSLDYERSLRAAFVKEDFVALAAEYLAADVKVVSTFKVPFLMIVKTADHALPSELKQRIQGMQKRLIPRYRRDLNEMRTFFALGGLRDDPFS
jgi:SAM-dependent methyltransferase